MTGSRFSFLDRLARNRLLRRWRGFAADAPGLPPAALADLRGQARGLHRVLGQFLREADSQLALPAVGSNAIRRPLGADWVWRPDAWRGLARVPGRSSVPARTEFGSEVTLFHDCRRSEISLRQLRNTRETDLAPFALRLDVFTFDGSFLSLALDLPPEAAANLRPRHLIRVETLVELEKPLEIYARLNIKHGPNIEQMLREMPIQSSQLIAEFDLSKASFDSRRVEKLWIDLILEGPQMNQVTFRDVTISRRLQAEI